MSYENEQIHELNEQINECLKNISEASHCKKLITSTEKDCLRLEKKLDELKQILKKEENDVDKLMHITFTNFFHTIINDKSEKLDQEKQEALTAKLKCDSALLQLEDCKSSLRHLKNKYNSLIHSKEEYEKLINKKKDFIMLNMPDKWNEIERLYNEDRQLSSELKELNEAINAGKACITYIQRAKQSLQSAEKWGTFDMLGGGMLSTMAKRENMNEAQNHINEMQKWLRSFVRELEDVDTYIDIDIQLDSFLGFADYFFDGFFVDWAVQSKIQRAREKVNDTYSELSKILLGVESQAVNINKRKHQIDNDIRKIIEVA